ncbi:DUF402 domain-containing protein [Phytomonospora sp. NPDC050363]|uniref:DUF402 domain-containing protein n=1 Tax=Phytomonospora sp. NPDC050363 TaxID=3155642 RepID=UPI0033D253AE
MSDTHWRIGRKLKFSREVLATWNEEVIGEDASGEWSVLRAGDPVDVGGGKTIEFGSDQFYCYPRDGWWVAHFWGPELSILVREPDGSVRRSVRSEPVYVDISAPAVRSDGGISFVDLVLDLVRTESGNIDVLDEDELDQVVEVGGITEADVAEARKACEEVLEAMRSRQPPFDGSDLRWKATLTGGPSA